MLLKTVGWPVPSSEGHLDDGYSNRGQKHSSHARPVDLVKIGRFYRYTPSRERERFIALLFGEKAKLSVSIVHKVLDVRCTIDSFEFIAEMANHSS